MYTVLPVKVYWKHDPIKVYTVGGQGIGDMHLEVFNVEFGSSVKLEHYFHPG